MGIQVARGGSVRSGVDIVRVGGLWRITRAWHPGLRPFLRSYAGYWDSGLSPYEVRVVPTGRAVVVINLGEPFAQVRRIGAPGTGSGRIGSMAVGLEDSPTLCAHHGGQEAIRLELTPLGAYRLFALPMGELAQHVVELHHILGPWAELLVERLAGTPDWGERFDLLDGVLLDRLDRGPDPAPEVGHAYHLLARTAGTIQVARISAEVGWSKGYLIRRFTEQIGLTPKTYGRVLRFDRAVRMLARGGATLAETSAICGFYDQAHLNREFRALGGTTPGRMLSARQVEGAITL